MRRYVLILLVMTLALVACDAGVETEEATTIDPLRIRQNEARTAAVQTALAPTLTMQVVRQTDVAAALRATETAAGIIPTVEVPPNVVTREPTMQVLVTSFDDALGNTMLDQTWLTNTFTAVDGTTSMLADFNEAVVVMQVTDVACDECALHLRALREAAEDFSQIELPYSIVFLILSSDDEISARALNNWATRTEIPPNEEMNWIIGKASLGLQLAIEENFGSMPPAESMAFIVIDRDGLSHINRRGPQTANEIRDIVIFYGEGPTSDEQASVEEE